MQYDYGLFKSPIFSINKNALKGEELSDYLKDFYMMSMDSLKQINPDENEEFFAGKANLFDTIDVKVSSNKDKYITASVRKETLLPNNITFSLIYYLNPDTKQKQILKADILLDDYKEIIFDSDKVLDGYLTLFNLTMPNIKDSYNILQINLYDFIRDFFNYNFMGYTNWLIINHYSNTTQFKANFKDYFSYQNSSGQLADVPEPSPEVCKLLL